MDDNRIGEQAKRGAEAATEMGNTLGEKAQNAAAQASSAIQDFATETGKQVADAAAKTYKQGAQVASEYVSKQGVQAAADYVTKQGAQAAEYVRTNTAEQPWVALLIAGAIGYAIAYMVHGR
jgi:ElaB/YqjD/DUF883 family membrane-anchored ribosome-binding protein